jgi:hypothetical protein
MEVYVLVRPFAANRENNRENQRLPKGPAEAQPAVEPGLAKRVRCWSQAIGNGCAFRTAKETPRLSAGQNRLHKIRRQISQRQHAGGVVVTEPSTAGERLGKTLHAHLGRLLRLTGSRDKLALAASPGRVQVLCSFRRNA